MKHQHSAWQCGCSVFHIEAARCSNIPLQWNALNTRAVLPGRLQYFNINGETFLHFKFLFWRLEADNRRRHTVFYAPHSGESTSPGDHISWSVLSTNPSIFCLRSFLHLLATVTSVVRPQCRVHNPPRLKDLLCNTMKPMDTQFSLTCAQRVSLLIIHCVSAHLDKHMQS